MPENGGRVSVPRRAPVVLACVDNLRLSREPFWVACDLVPSEHYRVRSLLAGTSATDDKAALIRFDVADRGATGGIGLSRSDVVGPYLYLRSGEGLHLTDRFFGVPSPASRIGLMAWGNRGETELKSLTIEKVEGVDRPARFFFSFDVEAASERAVSNPIDTLVWGKLGRHEYGIGRICDVLEQHGVTGNFLIDFATCSFEGDAKLRRIVDFLAGRGHEVHLHLHPEWLAQAWGLRIASGKSIHFDCAPYEMSRRLLDFTVSKYLQFVGGPPRVFRSGAYRMNPHLVLAAGAAGIPALSNVRGDMLREPGIGGDTVADREPFVWENGVIEIPVDVSSPEAGKFENYLRKYDAAMKRKDVERTFNVVMHSWSLTRRNEQGIHDAFEPEYERRLHQMCQHATHHGTAHGYSEYLDRPALPRPVARLAHIRTAEPEPLVYVPDEDLTTCSLCDAVFARSKVESDACPGCGLGTAHRQLKHVLDNFGNVFDGRRVLTHQAIPAERRFFLGGSPEIVDVGVHESSDAALGPDSRAASRRDNRAASHRDSGKMKTIGSRSFDCFLGLRFLDWAKKDPVAVAEVARVLVPGGLLVCASAGPAHTASAGPAHATSAGPAHTTSAGPGGADSTGRQSSDVAAGRADPLSKHFLISSISGFDPVTGSWSRIVLAYRR